MKSCFVLKGKKKYRSPKIKPFQVHFILNELVMGGMVLETNMTEILTRIEEQNKLEKEEVTQFRKS